MKKILLSLFVILVSIIAFTEPGSAKEKPNILVIWGDDVGMTNISAYSRGLMGYETPNIDRIAKEGALFTDYYGENLNCSPLIGKINPPIRSPKDREMIEQNLFRLDLWIRLRLHSP